MATKSRAVTVTTTRVQLVADESSSSVWVYNAGAADVHLGGSDVTTSNGVPLGAGEHVAMDVTFGSELWAVSAGSVACRVLEV